MLLPVSLIGRAELGHPSCPLSLLSSAVRAGFPSSKDDHLDNDLDLPHAVRHSAATCFWQLHDRW